MCRTNDYAAQVAFVVLQLVDTLYHREILNMDMDHTRNVIKDETDSEESVVTDAGRENAVIYECVRAVIRNPQRERERDTRLAY